MLKNIQQDLGKISKDTFEIPKDLDSLICHSKEAKLGYDFDKSEPEPGITLDERRAILNNPDIQMPYLLHLMQFKTIVDRTITILKTCVIISSK